MKNISLNNILIGVGVTTLIGILIVTFFTSSSSSSSTAKSASYSRISVYEMTRFSGGYIGVAKIDGKEYLVSTYGGIQPLNNCNQ